MNPIIVNAKALQAAQRFLPIAGGLSALAAAGGDYISTRYNQYIRGHTPVSRTITSRKKGMPLAGKLRMRRSRSTPIYKAPIEVKGVDVLKVVTELKSATPSSVNLINAVGQGTQPYQRVGSRVAPFSIEGWGNITNFSSVPVSLRMMVIYDRQPEGTQAPLVRMLYDTNSAGTVETSPFSGRNLQTTLRFRTLWDRLYHVQAGDANNGSDLYPFTFWKSLKGFKQQFIATGANIADMGAGAIYLVLVSDNTDVDNPLKVTWSTRFRYSDA